MKHTTNSFIFLVLFIVSVMFLTMPVSADYGTSGTISYSYGQSNSYSITGTDYEGTATIPLTSFFHRFTDAQIISLVDFDIDNWYSDNSGYTKNSSTTFTATVDSVYYGSGIVTFSDSSGDMHWITDFDTVDEAYASTLTGQKTVVLSYDSTVRNGMYNYHSSFMRGDGGITAEKPDGLIGDGGRTVWRVPTFSSWAMYYNNEYSYSFNESHSLSSINITKGASSTLCSVNDLDGNTYFRESGYSTTDYENTFLSLNGVVVNISFNLAPVVYKEVVLNDNIIGDDDGFVQGSLDSVSWGQNLYYTGDTANITTRLYDFDDATYSYYLNLYNTDDYLTTFEITSETEYNYYTFPTEWCDTSLLAKLQRVTEPYGTNEVNLAMAVSHFETLNFDSNIAFDKTSYDPGDVLKLTWSGAPAGSSVWLQSGSDGGYIEHNVSYSGSFYFTVPESTQETSYRVDIAHSGASQAMAICTINADIVPDYSTAIMNIGSFYANRSGWVPPVNAVSIGKGDHVKYTIYTNLHPDYYNVYYSPDVDLYDTFFMDYTIVDQYLSDIHFTYIDGVQAYQTVTNITLPNADSGVYRVKFEAVNVSTGSNDFVEAHVNVGMFDKKIDIYDYYAHKGYYPDTKYFGSSITVPYNSLITFGVLTDEVINTSSFKINGLEVVGSGNITSDYYLVRGHSFTEIGINTVEIEVNNIPTGSTDVMNWNVFVSGITVPADVTAQLYFQDTHITLGDSATVFYEVANITNPVLEIVKINNDVMFRVPIQENQSGGYMFYPEIAKQYTARIVDVDDTLYAQVYVWVADEGSEWEQDPDTGEWEEIPDADGDGDADADSFGTKFETMLSNDAFIALLVIIACVGAFGKIGGVVGVFLGMVVGISISFLMGYLPAWILFIMVLALCVVFVSKLINSFGGGE